MARVPVHAKSGVKLHEGKTRYLVEKGFRHYKRLLNKTEVRDLEGEGYQVTPIEGAPFIHDNDARLLNSMQGSKRSQGRVRPSRATKSRDQLAKWNHGAKWSGSMKAAPSSFSTHVVIRRFKEDGTYVDLVVPRENVEYAKEAQRINSGE